MPERPFNLRGIHDWRWFVTFVMFSCVLFTIEAALADTADGTCHCSGRDHIIADQFGDWRVRHVFYQDSLQYRYSDARTVILTDNGGEIPFQFNRRAWDNAVSIIVEGWIPRIVFTIDGEEFVYAERAHMHTLFIPVDQAVIRAFAMARNPIQVDIPYNSRLSHKSPIESLQDQLSAVAPGAPAFKSHSLTLFSNNSVQTSLKKLDCQFLGEFVHSVSSTEVNNLETA